jgi:hypothetical protein
LNADLFGRYSVGLNRLSARLFQKPQRALVVVRRHFVIPSASDLGNLVGDIADLTVKAKGDLAPVLHEVLFELMPQNSAGTKENQLVG